jgi:hypothetical protein
LTGAHNAFQATYWKQEKVSHELTQIFTNEIAKRQLLPPDFYSGSFAL